MNVTATDWLVLLAIVVVLFAVDLLAATLRPHAMRLREAALWYALFASAAVGFGLSLAALEGWDYAGQFFAGYLVENSLSVDNLFVFVIIMTAFAVPAEHQQRVLIFGIVASLCLRAAFIAIGAALLEALSFMFLIFGLALVWTAFRLLTQHDADPDVANGPLVRAARRLLPVTDRYDGGRLVTRESGRRVVTPLFIVFTTIGGTDMLFALDSIPAVFGVTSEAYIVFAANAFALLGLRALYFLVTGLLGRLVYLSLGLAVILAFIGAKLILHWAHGLSRSVPEIGTALSLEVIGGVLAATTAASLIRSRRAPGAQAPGTAPGPPARASRDEDAPAGGGEAGQPPAPRKPRAGLPGSDGRGAHVMTRCAGTRAGLTSQRSVSSLPSRSSRLISSGSASDWVTCAAMADLWMARAISASAPRSRIQVPDTPGLLRAAAGTPACRAAAVTARATAASPMSPVSGATTSTRSAEYSTIAC
jgi:tellurite resistance protein TerC